MREPKTVSNQEGRGAALLDITNPDPNTKSKVRTLEKTVSCTNPCIESALQRHVAWQITGIPQFHNSTSHPQTPGFSRPEITESEQLPNKEWGSGFLGAVDPSHEIRVDEFPDLGANQANHLHLLWCQLSLVTPDSIHNPPVPTRYFTQTRFKAMSSQVRKADNLTLVECDVNLRVRLSNTDLQSNAPTAST